MSNALYINGMGQLQHVRVNKKLGDKCTVNHWYGTTSINNPVVLKELKYSLSAKYCINTFLAKASINIYWPLL